jgi:hypothetical protein
MYILNNNYYIFILFIIIICVCIITIGSVICIFLLYKYDTTIINWLKHIIHHICNFLNSKIYSYNSNSQKILNTYGACKVVGLTIYRKPIDSLYSTFLNIISFGKWNEERIHNNSLNTLYHLSLACKLDNNVIVFCQKYEVIDISITYEPADTMETYTVPLLTDQSFSLNELLDKTRDTMGIDKYYLFDPINNNCQAFIKNVLEAANLYSDEIKTFVFQSLPQLPYITNFITCSICLTAMLVNKLINIVCKYHTGVYIVDYIIECIKGKKKGKKINDNKINKKVKKVKKIKKQRKPKTIKKKTIYTKTS